MTDPNPNVIEIEDEKEETAGKLASVHSASSKAVPPTYQPTNFNPKTFPFLASMLKKMSGAIKTEPQQRVQSSHKTSVGLAGGVAQEEIAPLSEMIKPIEVAGAQEVQEITRNLPAQKLFEVVEDLAGISVPVYSAKTSPLQIAAKSIPSEEKPSSESLVLQGQSHLQQEETREVSAQRQENLADEAVANYKNELAASQNQAVSGSQIIAEERAQPMVPEAVENAQNAENISELIFQFSQKIAQYNENQANTFENPSLQHERRAEPNGAAQNMQMQIENPTDAQVLPNTTDLPLVPTEPNQTQNQALSQQQALAQQYQVSDGHNQPQPNEDNGQELLPNQPGISQERVVQAECVGQVCAVSQPIQQETIELSIPAQAQQNLPANANELESLPQMQELTYTNVQPQQLLTNLQPCQPVLQNQLYSENASQKTNQTHTPVLQKTAQPINQPNLSTINPMPTLQQIKTSVMHTLPNFPVNWSQTSDSQFLELYEMIRQELRNNQIQQRIQNGHPAQNQNSQPHTQKQTDVGHSATPTNFQSFALQVDQQHMQQLHPQDQSTANPQQPSKNSHQHPKEHSHQQPTQHPQQQARQLREPSKKEDESDAIAQLLQMQNLSESELRKQISSMNPEWREQVSRMNHLELLSMLDQTIAELRKAVGKNVQQGQEGKEKMQEEPSCGTKSAAVELDSAVQPSCQPIQQLQQIQTPQNNQTLRVSQIPKVSQVPQTFQAAQIPQLSQPPQQAQVVQPPQNLPQNFVFPSVSELRSIIISKVPDLEPKVNSLSDNTLKEVFLSHVQKPTNQPQEPRPAQIPVISPIPPVEVSAEPEKPTIQHILSFCTEKFPQIAKDLKLLKDQQIREIYENLLLKMGPDPSPLKNKPKDNKEPASDKKTSKEQKQQISDKSGKSDKGENGLKRTHEAMTATNATTTTNNVNNTNHKKPQPSKTEKKKKLPPQEIRNILIAKLPQLKANIMMLDDNEIERIFYESIENGSVQTPPSKSDKPEPKTIEAKPVANPEKKPETPKPQTQSKPSVHILQTKDELRHKAMRTIILVHRQTQREQGLQTISKGTKTDSGVVKRCACDCCKKMDLNDLLLRMGDLLEERK